MTDNPRARKLLAAETDEGVGRSILAGHTFGVAISATEALHAITRALASPQDVGGRAALERLASSETMTLPFAIDDTPTGRELQARIGYARAALASAPAQPEQDSPQVGDRVDGVPGSPADAAAEGPVFSAAQPVDEDEVRPVAGPVSQDENGDWHAEIQALGGYNLLATFYGETEEGAARLRGRFLSTPLDPPEDTSFEAGRIAGLEAAKALAARRSEDHELAPAPEYDDHRNMLIGRALEANDIATAIDNLIQSSQGGAGK